MEDALRLSQQQRLTTRLSPQQVQFVRMLEMTTPEIEDEVRHALDDNPALESADPPSDAAADSPSPSDAGSDPDATFNETAEQMQLADYASDDDIPSYRLEASNRSADDTAYEPAAVDDSQSLLDTLNAQLAELRIDSLTRALASYIIGNIDDNGYLTRTPAAMSDDATIATGTDITPAMIESALRVVRGLDPAGVGATDLRDCLLLQVDRLPRSLAADTARTILTRHFDLFSRKHTDRLRRALGVDDTVLTDALTLIRSLNPKPGALVDQSASADRMRHIVPDFSVDVSPEGTFTVSLLSRTPELRVEQSFIPSPTPPDASRRRREADAFIRRKHDEAEGFIRLLRMRSATLMAVMTAIADIQREFFITDDKAAIRPMILKDIAAMTGYDLSVISRAAAGKYVLTRSGIYPLKMFFNERPKEQSDVSSHEIIDLLRATIDAEDKTHPLSDEALKDILVAKGYDIARRTVAKYRERLGLPVARLRRDF